MKNLLIKISFLYFLIIHSGSLLTAHEGIRGTLKDSISKQSLPFVSVLLKQNNSTYQSSVFTDELGNFKFFGLEKGAYQLIFSCVGYEQKTIPFEIKDDDVKTIPLSVELIPKTFNLSQINITNSSKDIGQVMNTITSVDMLLRPTNSAQDLMRLVPGLFIAQHQGGGKAEQIFLRGFDADHGTDFAVFWDGIPVNMPSHAHGQGYADSHFMISETIDQLNVNKGTYTTKYGDYATSGAAEFSTKNYIDNMVKVEYGQYGMNRVMGMLNLLGKDQHLFSKYKENLFIAAEDMYNQASYFVHPQNYHRTSAFGKYYGQLSERTTLTMEGSYFNAGWNGSGQVPERAIAQGLITRFGALDPSEGGHTDRSNANVILKTFFDNGAVIKNQVYYSYYQLNLFTDFTFLLNDSVHGDGINQRDKGRNIFGYNGSYEINNDVKGHNLKTVIGLTTKTDAGELSLRHQQQRTILDTVSIGNLYEQNVSGYLDETYNITNKLFVNAGVRADFFYFSYKDLRPSSDSVSGQTTKFKISPKFNLYYNANSVLQFFIRSGYGFHSNDARAVVTGQAQNTLPTALGYEIGSTFKPFKNMLVNAVLWGIHLQNELTFSADKGADEINGATQRFGADLSLRYQLSKILYFDFDVNYSHGRYTDLPEGQNYIPLAPTLTSVAGITVKQSNGFSGSLRYRYISDRPAIEDNTITAKGYFLLDAVINYKIKNYQFGMSVENLLNTNWNEAQFETQIRLKGESIGGIDQLCFTPGAPRIVKGSISYFF
jgi:hypothetical protein